MTADCFHIRLTRGAAEAKWSARLKRLWFDVLIKTFCI